MKIIIKFNTKKIKDEKMLEAYIRFNLKMFNIKSIKFVEERK